MRPTVLLNNSSYNEVPRLVRIRIVGKAISAMWRNLPHGGGISHDSYSLILYPIFEASSSLPSTALNIISLDQLVLRVNMWARGNERVF